MATIKIKYVVYKLTASGRRNHHSIVDMPLIAETDPGSYGPGDLVPINANPQMVYEGQIVSFAFAAVKGMANGSKFYTSIADFEDMEVGSSNIEGVVVYLPPGGPGGDHGFIVDAFNVDICDFSNSDFIDVFTNGAPDAAKKFTANEYGTIDTAPSAVDVTAYPTVDGVPYEQWQKIKDGSSTVYADREQPVLQNEAGILFAFYHTPPRIVIPPINPGKYKMGWIYVSHGVKVDGGGFVIGPGGGPVPVGPWTRAMIRFHTRIGLIFRRSGRVPASDLESATDQLNQIKGMH